MLEDNCVENENEHKDYNQEGHNHSVSNEFIAKEINSKYST